MKQLSAAEAVRALLRSGYDFQKDVLTFMARASEWRPVWDEFCQHAERMEAEGVYMSAMDIGGDIRKGRRLFRVAEYLVNNNDLPKFAVMYNAKVERQVFEQRAKKQKKAA